MQRKVTFLFFWAILLTVHFSCKKESANSQSQYYVKIKQDGNWINFPYISGQLSPSLYAPSLTELGITGQDNGLTERFVIWLLGPTISTGTYDTDNQSLIAISISYITQETTSPRVHTVAPNTVASSRYIVKINSITPTEIEGSFTGNFLYDRSNDVTLNITEGQFKLKR